MGGHSVSAGETESTLHVLQSGKVEWIEESRLDITWTRRGKDNGRENKEQRGGRGRSESQGERERLTIRKKERERESGRGRAGCESAVTTEGRGSAEFKYTHGRTILTRRGRQTYLHRRHAVGHQCHMRDMRFQKYSMSLRALRLLVL